MAAYIWALEGKLKVDFPFENLSAGHRSEPPQLVTLPPG